MLSVKQTYDRSSALTLMREIANKSFYVLDTETTGLDDTAEIVSIAILDRFGNILLDTLIKPVTPIDENGFAFSKHKITNEMVKDAPPFAGMWQRIVNIIGGETVLIYNAEYDVRMLEQSRKSQGGIAADQIANFVDVMEPYAAIVGEWNERFNNWKWQKLPGGSHTAKGDCQALLKLVNELVAEQP